MRILGGVSDSDSDPEELESEVDMNLNRYLMNKQTLDEAILKEFERVHQTTYKNRVSTIISSATGGVMIGGSTLSEGQKTLENRNAVDEEIDMLYKSSIAEVVNDHLLAIRMEFEDKYRIEEQRLQEVAAEDRRQKSVLYEEKCQQEKTEAEANGLDMCNEMAKDSSNIRSKDLNE